MVQSEPGSVGLVVSCNGWLQIKYSRWTDGNSKDASLEDVTKVTISEMYFLHAEIAEGLLASMIRWGFFVSCENSSSNADVCLLVNTCVS